MLLGMINIASILPLLTFVPYVIAGVFIIVAGYRGWKNGLSRQLVRTVMAALAFVVALFATDWISTRLLAACDEKTVWELLEMTKIPTVFNISPAVVSTIQDLDSTLSGYILPLFVPFFTMPIVFVLVFLILNAVLRGGYKIIAGVGGMVNYGHSDTDRLVATFVGAAQGLAIAMIISLPLSGAVRVIHESVAEIQAEAPATPSTIAITETYDQYIKPLENNLLLTYTYDIGNKVVLSRYEKYAFSEDGEEDGEIIDIKDEWISVIRVIAETTVFSEDTKWDALTPEEKSAISAIIDQTAEDARLSTIVSDILKAAAVPVDKIISHSSKVQEPFATLLSSIVFTGKKSDKLTVHDDLTTLKNIYFMLLDNGVLTAMNESGDMTAALSATDADGKTVISRVIDELNRNPRAGGVTDALTDITIAILMEQTGMNGAARDEIRAVRNDVADMLRRVLPLKEEDYADHESYVNTISETVNASLIAHNITLDNGTIRSMAENIADPRNFCDAAGNRVSTGSTGQITEFLLSYYDASASANP